MSAHLASRLAFYVLGTTLVLSCRDPSAPSERDLRPILFIGRTTSLYDATGEPGIYSVQADGSELRLLTNGVRQALYPAWSRDGSLIAFSSGQTRGNELWLMNADGTHPHPAGAFPPCGSDYVSLTWSPTANRLAAECSGNTRVFDFRTGASYSLSDAINSAIVQPDWSPNENRLAFGKGSFGDVFSVPADGTSPASVLITHASDVAWSPDGSRLAFVGDGGIFIANVDGSGRKQLTTAWDDGPTWSPDGRWLAFHRVSSLCVECGPHWAVYAVRTDGTGLRRLTPDSLLASRPAW